MFTVHGCNDVLVKLHSLATCIAVTYFLSAEMAQVPMTTGRQELSNKKDSNDWKQPAGMLWQTARKF